MHLKQSTGGKSAPARQAGPSRVADGARASESVITSTNDEAGQSHSRSSRQSRQRGKRSKVTPDYDPNIHQPGRSRSRSEYGKEDGPSHDDGQEVRINPGREASEKDELNTGKDWLVGLVWNPHVDGYEAARKMVMKRRGELSGKVSVGKSNFMVA
jgi:hypothetical protein